MLKRASLLLVVVSILSASLPRSAAAPTLGRLTFAGIERTFHVYDPVDLQVDNPLPVVIGLHPFASSGNALAAMTGLAQDAAAAGFLAVFPDSHDLSWNTGREDTPFATGLSTTDDPGFIAALITHLEQAYAIDRARIHLVGYGNGASLAYRLACENPDQYATITAVGATLWNFQPDQCDQPAKRLALLIALGELDAYNPPEGRILTEPGEEPVLATLGLNATRDFWLARQECDPAAAQTFHDAALELHTGCISGGMLATFSMPGIGHNWPRAGAFALNATTLDLNALLLAFWQGDPSWPEALPPAPAPVSESQPPRSYTYFLPPASDPEEPLPVVIALHGRPGNGSGMAYLFDLNRFAASRGYLAVYPDGLENEWNYVQGFQGFANTGADDIRFLADMIDDIARDVAIDRGRVYIAGFSNGGFMAQRIACEAPQDYAGFAVFGATLFTGFASICETETARPMLFVHGTRDISVPWGGIQQGDLLLSYSALDTVAFWLEHNRCALAVDTRAALPSLEPAPSTFVHRYTFADCPLEREIVFYAVEGGGHNLPGVPARIDDSIAGVVNMDMHAAEITLDFFDRHALPTPPED